MKRAALSDLRKQIGLNQEEMAKGLGISHSHYKAIEAGIQNPSYKLIKKFRSMYGDQNLWRFFSNELFKS